jgi:hypothetical protein
MIWGSNLTNFKIEEPNLQNNKNKGTKTAIKLYFWHTKQVDNILDKYLYHTLF